MNQIVIQMSQEKQKIRGPLSRDRSVASNVVRHLPQKAVWTVMKESTLVRSHTAAQSVTKDSDP